MGGAPRPLQERLLHPGGESLGASVVIGSRPEWIVVGSATAVPHRFYRHIAQWLATERGFHVLTFDYRGIGASRPERLRGYRIDYRDWADDFALAVEWAAARGPVCVLGHSFGGHAFGMTPAHEKTYGLYWFGGGVGSHVYMPRAESIRVRAFWNVVGPVTTAALGYVPMSKLKMGEDLPLGVYRDWKRWCSYENYFFGDPEAKFTDEFARVTEPVLGVSSTDDLWGQPESAAAFLAHYPKAEHIVVSPSEIGLRSIGHMGYVRPACAALWPAMAGWFEVRFAGR